MLRTHTLFAALFLCAATRIPAQVFVVGEKTATEELSTDFTPTDLALPGGRLSERGRRDLVRSLEAEQGFAHRALPLGAGLTLKANGPLQQTPAEYKKIIFKQGQAVAAGDRVVITALEVKPDRLIVDLNGGPYAKHRFLSHIQFNDNNVVQDTGQKATGSRVTLVFPGGFPEISPPEIKALLEPLIDFRVKTGVQAYADTLPAPVKRAIAQHDVLVGMDHRMVLAALGPPESKVREHTSDDPAQARFEEWIYGAVPKTVKFVRFSGDRVTQVKIAALGKPIEVRDKDEMAAYRPEETPHEVLVGDGRAGEEQAAAAPPTLRKDGEPAAEVPTGLHKVQFPDAKAGSTRGSTASGAGIPGVPAPSDDNSKPGTGRPQ